MAIDMKSILVKSVKQGASAGAIRAASKKLAKVLAPKFPAIALLPPEVRELAVCLLVSMVAQAAPEMPGAKQAEALAASAFEGLLTSATASIVQELVEQVGPLFEELAAANKAALLGEK